MLPLLAVTGFYSVQKLWDISVQACGANSLRNSPVTFHTHTVCRQSTHNTHLVVNTEELHNQAVLVIISWLFMYLFWSLIFWSSVSRCVFEKSFCFFCFMYGFVSLCFKNLLLLLLLLGFNLAVLNCCHCHRLSGLNLHQITCFIYNDFLQL